jgi:hypothetical protein
MTRPAHVTAVRAALRRVPANAKPSDVSDVDVATIFSWMLTAYCKVARCDEARVRAACADPRGQNNPATIEASRARAIAIYLANTVGNIPQRCLAHHVGITPAGVCLALRRVEIWRDDLALDRRIRKVERKIGGDRVANARVRLRLLERLSLSKIGGI